MNTAKYVDEQIAVIKQKDIPLADKVWETALLCIGWPYIFGDRGSYCTSSHRKAVYAKHPKYTSLIDKCQVLNSSSATSCSGCKWYPGGQKVRGFDCRGYTYWALLQFGIKIMGAGATTQWDNEDNWAAKGTIDSIPEDKLVCLFYRKKGDPKTMEHTGFGYKGETLECSNGVQYFKSRNSKWTFWAIPKGVYDGEEIVVPSDSNVKLPTLRKGSKGEYVALLQTLLLNRGYKLPKYGVDSDFGNETLSAVKQFQKDTGLTVDGVVGPNTWEKLESAPEQTKIKLYTVTIPNLNRETAEKLLAEYPGRMVLEDG